MATSLQSFRQHQQGGVAHAWRSAQWRVLFGCSKGMDEQMHQQMEEELSLDHFEGRS